MEWEVIRFFLKAFWRGILIGLVIRFSIALFTKSDVSLGGAVRSGLVGGFIYLIINILQFVEVST